jgi:hypothetical protein
MLQISGHEYYCLGCRRREWLMKKTLEIERFFRPRGAPDAGGTSREAGMSRRRKGTHDRNRN